MLPYTRGLMLDNTSNYGIVKTEAVFGFGPSNANYNMENDFNSTEPLEWIFTPRHFPQKSLEDIESPKENKETSKKILKPKTTVKKTKHGNKKKAKRKSKGVKKCIFKILKKGEGGKKTKRNKFPKMSKKFMMPLILGLLAAKSILIPIALKALAFVSVKGLMMGVFSTVMASIISLKGMFDHSHGYQHRKDDAKTQVEIIQVPSKPIEDHIYYDDHYRRGDFIPVMMKN